MIKLTVKNVKTMRGHDGMPGAAWECDIYIDGVKAGWALDDSWGGLVRIEFNSPSFEKQFNDYVKTLPSTEMYGQTIEPNGDMVIADLVDEFENEKRLRKMVKKGTYFRCKGDKEGVYRTVKVGRKIAPFTPQIKAWIVRTYPNLEEILNEKFQ